MKKLIFLLVHLVGYSLLIAQPSHSHEHDGVSFEVGKPPKNYEALETKQTGQVDTISDFCTRDFFSTSGSTDQWKIPANAESSTFSRIRPGDIFDLSRYNGGSFFEKITAYKRERIKIHLTPSSQGNVVDSWVERPKLSTNIESDGVHPIWDNLKPKIQQRTLAVTSEFTRVVSEEQLRIELSGAVPVVLGKIKFNASNSTSSKKNKSYYLLDMEERIFSLEATGNKLQNNNFFLPGEFPNNHHDRKDFAYVSSVQYGRRITVVIESEKSLDELTTKSSIDFKKGTFGNKVRKHKANKEATLNYSIYILGGSDGYKILPKKNKAKLSDLISHVAEIINTPMKPKHAAPISFELRSIRGSNPLIVSTYSPIESTVDKCNATWQVSLTSVTANEVKDGTGEKALELYGNFTVKAFKDDGSRLYEDGFEPIEVGHLGVVNPAGKTTFAEQEHFWKIREGYTKTVNQDSYARGGKRFSIPHDALFGKFKIYVDAKDHDKTSKSDSFGGPPSIVDMNELADGQEVNVTVRDKRGNDITFTFLFELKK